MENTELVSILESLVSEEQNPETLDIDELSSLEIVKKINFQDSLVSTAVSLVLTEIAGAVELIIETIKSGGRLIFIGAGTSGRLGVLDAVECIPTFGLEEGIVVGILAGGEPAMFKSQEGIEDREEVGKNDLESIAFSNKDILVGIAASGRTPYVVGALKYANQIGAKSIALSCNPKASIAEYTDVAILPIVGPEVLTGSTRMKSGTAQKMVLNMLTTACMIKLGKSYTNLMVDVQTTNEKLVARGIRMIKQVTGVTQDEAREALVQSKNQVKLAILMILTELDLASATRLLNRNDGFIKKAIKEHTN